MQVHKFIQGLDLLVDQFIKEDALLTQEAKKLLDPACEDIFTFEVNISGSTYFLEARSGVHTADLQKRIEIMEGFTFDELGWSYLRPQDIRLL